MIRKYIFFNLSLLFAAMICGQSIQNGSFTDKGYEFDLRNFHIVISDSVTDFFNNDLYRTVNFYHEIGETIVQAIVDSLNDYQPEKISNLSGSDCKVTDIQAAINEYKKGILDGTRKLTIVFEFYRKISVAYHKRHDPILKYYNRKRKSNPKNSDGKKYLKPEDLINYGFGAMAQTIGFYKEETIRIRNCYKDFFIKRAIGKPTWLKKNKRINALFWRAYSYFKRNGEVSTEIPEPNDPKWWSKAPDKKISFKSCVFHEMLHIAFSNEKYLNVKSREHDEASIEDTTFKVYPRVSGGSNTYEYSYSFALWWYFNSKYKGLPIKEQFKEFGVDPRDYFTIGEGQEKKKIIIYSRGFNPPYELKYFKIPDQMDIIKNPVLSDTQKDIYNQVDPNENWVCDDCRDEATKPYAFPYTLCDGHLIFQDSGGGVVLDNSFGKTSVLAKKNATNKSTENLSGPNMLPFSPYQEEGKSGDNSCAKSNPGMINSAQVETVRMIITVVLMGWVGVCKK